MPVCRNCHARLEKTYKDICPICGCENPFLGMSSDTVEVTTEVEVENKDYHPCHKRTLMLYFATMGIIGVPFFYIHKKMAGIIYLLVNVVLLIAAGYLFAAFWPALNFGFALLISLTGCYAANALFGAIYTFRPNIKDGRNEFIL